MIDFGSVHSWIAMGSKKKSSYGYMINRDNTWAVVHFQALYLLVLLGKLGVLKKRGFADASPSKGFGRYIS